MRIEERVNLVYVALPILRQQCVNMELLRVSFLYNKKMTIRLKFRLQRKFAVSERAMRGLLHRLHDHMHDHQMLFGPYSKVYLRFAS